MSSLALVPATSPVATPASARAAHEPVIEISITELVRIEERLAVEAHLGDLHPAHAHRLAAVSAELDRRWSTFA